MSNHLDLTAYSKQHQSQITKEIIARDTAGAIEQLKTEGEQQLDHINGQLQGEVALKSMNCKYIRTGQSDCRKSFIHC